MYKWVNEAGSDYKAKTMYKWVNEAWSDYKAKTMYKWVMLTKIVQVRVCAAWNVSAIHSFLDLWLWIKSCFERYRASPGFIGGLSGVTTLQLISQWKLSNEKAQNNRVHGSNPAAKRCTWKKRSWMVSGVTPCFRGAHMWSTIFRASPLWNCLRMWLVMSTLRCSSTGLSKVDMYNSQLGFRLALIIRACVREVD